VARTNPGENRPHTTLLGGLTLRLGDRDLPFSLQEYHDRYSRLQAALGEHELEGALIFSPENIYYLTGYRTPGYYAYQALVAHAHDKPALVTRYFELYNATALSWVEQTASYQDHEDPLSVTLDALQSLGLGRGRLGVDLESWFVSYLRLDTLLSRLDTKPVNCSSLVDRLRLVKSSQELAYIREAARIVEQAMKAAMDAIKPGVSEDSVAAAAIAGGVRAGCEYTSLPYFVASGPRTALPHATWAGRVIGEGDLVFLELVGTTRRYSAALLRTISVGRATTDQQRMADAVREGVDAAIAAIRPGATSGDVDRACRSRIAKHGYGDLFRHRTGYSIGVSFPPDWGEGHIMSLKAGDSAVLREGMVFHMPPGCFDYGMGGIGFSETVAVAATGCEVLTNYNRNFVLDPRVSHRG